MAATTANALKSLIEGLGLGLSAYRDEAPEGTARPYVTVTEAIAVAPDPLEDAQASTVVETATVDLWQTWKDLTTGAVTESYTHAPALYRGIHGKRLNLIGTAITYVVLVSSGPLRLLQPDDNVVHHVLTLDIHREI